MIPVLGIAGSLAAKRATAVTRRHVADSHAAVRRVARRRRADGRRAHVRARARARADRRAPADDWQRLNHERHALLRVERADELPDAADRLGRAPRLVREAAPARAGPQSRDVRRIPRQHLHDLDRRRGLVRARRRRGSSGLRARDRGLALAHGAVRELRGSGGRGARQGAGRDAALDAPARARETAARPATATSTRLVEASALQARRPRARARRTTSSRPTARSSKASRRSTRAPSPANRRPCCAKPAATSRPSRAARACCPTGSSCASRAARARAFSTA